MARKVFVWDVILTSAAVILGITTLWLMSTLYSSLTLSPPPRSPLVVLALALTVNAVVIILAAVVATRSTRAEPLWAVTVRRTLALVTIIGIAIGGLAMWRYKQTYEWMSLRTASMLGVHSAQGQARVDLSALGADVKCPKDVDAQSCAKFAEAKTKGLQAITASLQNEYSPSLVAAAPTGGGEEGGHELFSCKSDDAAKCIVAGAAVFACLILSDGAGVQECLALGLAIFGILNGGNAQGISGGSGGSQNVGEIVAVAVQDPGNTQRLDRTIDQAPGVGAIDSAISIVQQLPESVAPADKKKLAIENLTSRRNAARDKFSRECETDLADALSSEAKQPTPNWCETQKILTRGSCARAELSPAERTKVFEDALTTARKTTPTIPLGSTCK